MNRLLYIFAKKQRFDAKISDFVRVSLVFRDEQVDCYVMNENKEQNFVIPDISPKNLRGFLSIPQFGRKLDKDFQDELELHNETMLTLSDCLLFAENFRKKTNPKFQQTLALLLKTTAFETECKIVDGCSLKLLTTCNTKAKAGYDLHFQVCLDDPQNPKFKDFSSLKNAKIKKGCMPDFSFPTTLSFLQECFQHYSAEMISTISAEEFIASGQSTKRSYEYNKLKNKYLFTFQPEAEK